MILSIDIQDIENESFYIEVDKKTFVIDAFSKKVMIDLLKEGTYEVVIKQKRQKTFSKFLGWVIWFVTILLQAVFHILTINNDIKWYKDVAPYIISARFSIEVNTDTELSILLYYENYGEWKRPNLICKQKLNLEVIYIPDLNSFSIAYINYVKKVSSVSLFAIVLFLYFLCVALKINNMIVIICSILLIGTILFIDCFLFKSQYDLLRKMQKCLMQENKKTGDGSGNTGDGSVC